VIETKLTSDFHTLRKTFGLSEKKGGEERWFTVKRILQAKKKGFWTITPDMSAYEALQLMAENNVGALLVVSEEQDLLGIFTERDYSRKVVLKGRSSKDTLSVNS